MDKLIVFSDIHISVHSEFFEFARDRFSVGLAHAQHYHGDAKRIIVCGDLTDNGDIPSMQAVREELTGASIPVELMIGNHDHRENFLTVFPEVTTDKNGYIARAVDTTHARLLLLDTLFAPPYDYPDSHAGFLCEKRLDWLDEQLQEAGQKPTIIFMHHPPHRTGFRGMDTIRLINGDAFYKLVLRHANVRQIISGHVHRTVSGCHRGIAFANFKSTQLQMPLLLESPLSTLAIDEPPAYGIILIDDDGVIVHTEDFNLTDHEALRS